MHNPFLQTPMQQPGNGVVHLALLPPNTPAISTLTYQYPLKLISPTPLAITPTKSTSNGAGKDAELGRDDERLNPSHLVHTLYTLTYGGGLVAGDTINLHITLDPNTRLVLLTQGSTKIFKSPSRDILSRQTQTVQVHPRAALCFLPDPVQPFEKSAFFQEMRYEIMPPNPALPSKEEKRGSLCVLDWVSQGRSARGEDWTFWRYGSRNEVILVSGMEKEEADEEGKQEEKEDERTRRKRLLLRDNLVLDPGADALAQRMDGKGVYGTLILYGALFTTLGRFFMEEFKAIPRIGGRKWDRGSGSSDEEEQVTEADIRRRDRQKQELKDGLLWSAASVRGCVVVKFGAKEVEGGRRWIKSMLEEEGSVVDQFGERALICLK